MSEKQNAYIKALAAKLGTTEDDVRAALEAAKPAKREWRKYYIYLTPAQLEQLKKAHPDVQIKIANPGNN